MKITKRQLKRIIKEELQEMQEFDPSQELGAQGLSRDDTLYYEPEEEATAPEDSPRSLLVTVLTARMEEEKDRLQRALPTSNVSNDEWRSAVDQARDVVFPEVEPESQSTSWLDAPSTMPPPQKPFSVTEPGVRPTLQEQNKKILSE